MKFRAVTTRSEAIKQIHKSLLASSRLISELVIRIDADGLQLIADPRPGGETDEEAGGGGQLLSRCDLSRENVFAEYSFRGIDSTDNRIFISVRGDSLTNVVNSMKSHAKSLKMKLANSADGSRVVLRFTVLYPSFSESSNRQVDYNLFVSIIHRKYWHIFRDEPIDNFQISMYLPNYHEVTMIIEKLASLALIASISGKYADNGKASFIVGAYIPTMAIKSKYTDLELDDRTHIVSSPNILPAIDREDRTYKVRVNFRRLSQVFSAVCTIRPTLISCSISHEKFVCFKFFSEFSHFKIILPNHEE